MKYAVVAYAAAILLVGGIVTALTAPKHEDAEQQAEAQAVAAERAKQPPSEMTQADTVAARVEEVRGLEFEQGAPALEMAPATQIQQQLTTLDTEAKSEVKGSELQREQKLESATGILLAQAGALSPQDVTQAARQFAEPGALGVYVPAERKVLVSKELADSDPELAELVLVHQLTRALEGERFGETARLPRPFHDGDAAELALHDGTAALTASEYARRFLGAGEPADPASLVRAPGSGEEAPPALQALADFAPEDGARFVAGLHERGGWDAVDAAHREAPATTREILHPESRGEAPVPPPAPSLDQALGQGWQQQASADVGELDTIALLRAGLEEGPAREAAEGWRAGHFEHWAKGTSGQSCRPPCRKGSATVAVWRWDAPADGQQFARGIRRTLERAAGAEPEGGRGWKIEDGGAALVREGRFTALAFAPDAPTAGRLAQAALAG
jgi:hypothetical protein